MNNDLLKALESERSIFRTFNSCTIIDDFEVFHSPNLEEIAHWNLAYPIIPNPRFSSLLRVEDHYKSISVTGNVATSDEVFRGVAVEESEYFVLDGSVRVGSGYAPNRMAHRPENLSEFANMIQRSFSLDQKTIDYFLSKMRLLAQFPSSHFYVIEIDSKIVGGCSTFRADSGADFIFNVATTPETQGQGIATTILGYAALKSQRPIYTYSHNPKMRESILPGLGFRFLGTVFCVPIAEFLAGTNS